MTVLDLRPGLLNLRFRPGDAYTVRLTGPAGWLAARAFTATLGGQALTVTEQGDALVIDASAVTTALFPSVPAEWKLIETGGNVWVTGRWSPDLTGTASQSYTTTVTLSSAAVALTLVAGPASGGGVDMATQAELDAETAARAAADAALQALLTDRGFVPIPIQTANYAAQPGDYVPVDTTAGIVTITLPSTPIDGATVTVRRSIGAANNVTVACSGGAHFQLVAGTTSTNLTAVGQTNVFRYDAGLNVWYSDPTLGTGALISLIDNNYTAAALTLSRLTGVTLTQLLQAIDATLVATGLRVTPVKTAGYVAVPGDYVPVDTTAGIVTITLPDNPADGTTVAVKRVAGATNAANVACAGTDVFNIAAGVTTSSLSLLNMHQTFVYKAIGRIWYIETSISKGGLDLTYAKAASCAPIIAALNNNSTVSLTNTASSWVDVESLCPVPGTAAARPTDVVYPASLGIVAGQWLCVTAQGWWNTEAPAPYLAPWSIVAGAPVRNLGNSAGTGVTGWNAFPSVLSKINGPCWVQVQAGDISADGSVRLRLRYRSTAGPKLLYTGLGGTELRLEGTGPF